MEVQPGGVYAITLELAGADNIGPSWLVGAFAQAFPRADVVQVDQYEPGVAVVRVRWRGVQPQQQIPEGSVVAGGVEGLSIPGEAVPTGTVVSVEDTGQVARTLEQVLPDSVKLVIAGGLFLTTWYLTNKIKGAHG